MTNKRICITDLGDTQLTNETLSIVEAVFQERSYDTDTIDYHHLERKRNIPDIGTEYDLIISFGAEAMHDLCRTDKTMPKYAGSLTYSRELETWVLPTFHPNCIYQGQYGQFDQIYDHINRAIHMCTGVLDWPEVDAKPLNWEFIGHNGTQGWDGDPKVWSGYFESTPQEIARAREVLLDWLNRLEDHVIEFGIDTESYDTNHFSPMTMIQAYDPESEKAYAFIWGNIEPLLHLWQKFLNHKNARFDWHNIKHDAKMIRHHMGVMVDERHNDTLSWAMGTTEKGSLTGLKYQARQLCSAPFWDEGLEEWLDSDKDKVNYGHIRPDVLAEYGCLDVFYGYGIAQVLPELVDREGTRELVENILLPFQRTAAELEYVGIRVDQDYAHELSAEWEPLIEKGIKDVQEYARKAGFPRNRDVCKSQVIRLICDCVPVRLRGELADIRCTSYGKYLRETHRHNPKCPKCNNRRYIRDIDTTLNVSSNPQMQHLCFDVLGMTETFKPRSTDKNFWNLNANHEFAKLVSEYRELKYLNTNIIQGFSKFIREDGRIHPNILPWGTTTGRLAIRDPAVQTIPSRSKTGKKTKRIFLPDEGDLIVNSDYANLEIYVAHHLTGDEALLEAVKKDMHKTTAAAMYAKTVEEVTADERQSAKPVNFMAGYNAKANKVANHPDLVGITGGLREKGQEFLDAFWGTYKDWDAGRRAWIAEALATGELTTELGRKRRWSLITNDNQWKVENQATNFKGQSMASDLCLTSLIRLQELLSERGWGRVMMSVHDSILFSIHPEFMHDAVELIRQIMTTPIFETNTPFKVDVEVGKNYGQVEKYDEDIDYTAWEIS